MNRKAISVISCVIALCFFCTMLLAMPINVLAADVQSSQPQGTAKQERPKPRKQDQQPSANNAGGSQYSVEQAVSDKAQLSTIAFNGLAFITGNAGADTFFPPGKVADFFGFQYMRDVDQNGYGHNTTFLTKAANNVLYILNDTQKAKLIALAQEQEQVYKDFAYNRFLLMNAFRRNLEGTGPTGAKGLSKTAVAQYTSNLYSLDAQLSYRRAVVMGEIISSISDEQRAYLDKMSFDNSATWPDIQEEPVDKQNLSHTVHVAVMTYASELFSWYKGSLESDTYFCPERHGTYFGGFYMKDYPAMGNPNYFISTSLTGDSGEGFLNVLTDEQRERISSIIDLQSNDLKEIVTIRRQVSTELRKGMTGETINKARVFALIKRYGALDGEMSYYYASRFAEVNATLTDVQRAALIKLRNLDVVPEGAYYFSTPIQMPSLPSTDFLFGIGSAPAKAGTLSAPSSFAAGSENMQAPAQNSQGPNSKNGGKPPKKQNKTKPPINETPPAQAAE